MKRSIEFELQQSVDHRDVLFQFDARPFLSLMDVESEYIAISNPLKEDISLENYVLVDSKRLHVLKFPAETLVPANSVLHVYTCPGGNHQARFNEPNVLWTNNDGTLRRKEVLHNREPLPFAVAPLLTSPSSLSALHDAALRPQ